MVVLDDHSERPDRRDRRGAGRRRRSGPAGLRRPSCRPAGAASSTPAGCWPSEARHPLLVFLDADVRLAPDALARMAAFLSSLGRRPGQRDPSPGDGGPAGEAGDPADPLHPARLPADPPDAAEPSALVLGRMRPALHRTGRAPITAAAATPRSATPSTTASSSPAPFAPRASRPTSSTRPTWPPAGCTGRPARSGSAWPRTPARPWPPLP